jgi:hypothetical protein
VDAGARWTILTAVYMLSFWPRRVRGQECGENAGWFWDLAVRLLVSFAASKRGRMRAVC